MDNFILTEFPRSGSRYFDAFFCSRFRESFKTNSNSCKTTDLSDLPSKNFIYKTHDFYEGQEINHKVVVIVRDIRDIMVNLCEQMQGYTKSDICKHQSVTWVKYMYTWMYYQELHPENILFIRYEDLINDVDLSTKKLKDFFDITPLRIGKRTKLSRRDELSVGIREIGQHKDFFADAHIKIIEDNTADCIADLDELLEELYD